MTRTPRNQRGLLWLCVPVLTAVLLGTDPRPALAGDQRPSSGSATLYVDARRGDDAAPGTAGRPLRSLREAATRLAAGVTLVVGAGDYRGEGALRIRVVGSPDAPVRVVAAVGQTPIVEQVIVEGSAWVEVSGLTIIGPKPLPAGWRDMPAVVVDDPSVAIDLGQPWRLRAPSVRAKYASYAAFVSWMNPSGTWTWERDYSGGIDVHASRHVDLTGNDVSFHTACIGLHAESSDVRVEANSLHHCVDALWGDRRTGAFSFSSSTVRGNQVVQIFREGLRLTYGAHHNLVENNRVEYAGTNLIATYGAGGYNVIQHNVAQFGGYYAETMRFPGPSGISLHSSGPDTVADGNYVAYVIDVTQRDGNGVIIDANAESALVANNVIYRPMGSGVSSARSGNARILHNTIVEAGHQTSSRKNGMGIRITRASDVGNVIANNLLYRPRNGGILFAEGNLAAQAYIDHNLFYVPGAPLVGNSLDPAAAYWDLASLHADGWCRNSVAADPLLGDPAGGELAPRAGSPAFDSGTAQHSIAVDHVGHPRSPSAPTIGAYERAAPGAAPPCADDGPGAIRISDLPGDDRFRVCTSFDTALGGGLSGFGHPLALDSLGFSRGMLAWFFAADNPEVLLKVLDGCGLNDAYWVFVSAGTNAGFTVTVVDTVTGAWKTYANPDQTAFQSIQDTSALPCS